jgi:hypothetical protein
VCRCKGRVGALLLSLLLLLLANCVRKRGAREGADAWQRTQSAQVQ